MDNRQKFSPLFVLPIGVLQESVLNRMEQLVSERKSDEEVRSGTVRDQDIPAELVQLQQQLDKLAPGNASLPSSCTH
jgi:hypothetical protein